MPKLFRKMALLVGIGSLLVSVSSVCADVYIYANATNGLSYVTTFGELDLSNGTFSPQGNSSVPWLVGMGEDASGNLYSGGSSTLHDKNDNHLYGITPSPTFSLTAEPDTGAFSGSNGKGYYVALGSTAGGTLYGLGSDGYFYEVGTDGAITKLPDGLPGFINFNKEFNYAISAGANALYFTANDNLYTINSSTGALTAIGTGLGSDVYANTPLGGINSLVYTDGTLYGLGVQDQPLAPGQLNLYPTPYIFTINTQTGVASDPLAIAAWSGTATANFFFGGAAPIVPLPAAALGGAALLSGLAIWRRAKARKPFWLY